jgi:hypothetical protein
MAQCEQQIQGSINMSLSQYDLNDPNFLQSELYFGDERINTLLNSC